MPIPLCVAFHWFHADTEELSSLYTPLTEMFSIGFSGPLHKRLVNFCSHWYSPGFGADVSLTQNVQRFGTRLPPAPVSGLAFPLSWNIFEKRSVSIHSDSGGPAFGEDLGGTETREWDGEGMDQGDEWAVALLGAHIAAPCSLGCLPVRGVWWMVLVWLFQVLSTPVTWELQKYLSCG